MKNLLTCMGNWLAWVTQRTIQKILCRDFLDGMKPYLTSGQVPPEGAFFSLCPLTPTISFFLFPHPLPPSFFLLPLSHSSFSFSLSCFLPFSIFYFFFIFFIFMCYHYFSLLFPISLFICFLCLFVYVCSACVCVKEEKLYHNKTLLGCIVFI
jgi:hypothetical protein